MFVLYLSGIQNQLTTIFFIENVYMRKVVNRNIKPLYLCNCITKYKIDEYKDTNISHIKVTRNIYLIILVCQYMEGVAYSQH